MDISLEKKDDLNAVITIKLDEKDYEPKVIESLKKYRRQVQIKGFRQGKAPLNMIRQMVGNQIKMEELDKLVSESLSKYLVDEKIDYLFQPLPSESQEPLDIENAKEFTFKFDIALKPEVNVTLDKRTKIPFYNIAVDDDIIKQEIERYQNQYGSTSEVDTVSEKSYIKANLVQVNEDGSEKENGITKEAATLSVDLIKDEDIKKQFIGLTEGAELTIDLKKAYPNDTEISAMLGIEKDEVADLDPNFKIQITGITEFKPAELNEEFFTKAFGEGKVSSEEEMKEFIKSDIEKIYKEEADYRFGVDAKEKLISSAKFELPDEFAKRYLKVTDEKGAITDEVLEKEYPAFQDSFKWQLITNKIATDIDVKVELEDLREESRKFTEMQFRQYGLPLDALGEEQMNSFIDKNLEKEEDRNRFAERIVENKVIAHVKEQVKLAETDITMDEFKKLYE